MNEFPQGFQRNSRRSFIRRTAAIVAAMATPSRALTSTEPTSRLGLVTYCCRIRNAHLRRTSPSTNLSDPFVFLDHCHKLQAGGMQADLGVMDQRRCQELQRKAADLGLFVEAIVSSPKERSELESFEAAIRTASQVGVAAARTTIIPGRRYEYFESLERFRELDARGRRALELAAPIAEKYKVPLAVENHKDHRSAERVALFEHISSEYVGACVDTGNSIALLEDPLETVDALAPWALSVHLKDQAVAPYEDGFLLADIPLGQGCLDLKEMVRRLRVAKPDIHFSLELITRDPLKVPTFGNKYWATFPDLPAKTLATATRWIRENASGNMQYISKMAPQEQLAREDANVRESLSYARRKLAL